MKPSTSKTEGKKRKREVTPVPEIPKKSKVYAQRKFAQGTGVSGSSVSSVKNCAKVKNEVQPPTVVPEPLITKRVPTTSQFLDFLCFRGTPLLSPELHYLRDAGTFTSSSAKPASQPQMGPSGTKLEKVDAEKSKPPPCVQALRKKYQEQRIAKEKATSVTTLAKKVKGKNMVRTRSATVSEEAVKAEKKPIVGLRSGLNRAQNALSAAKVHTEKVRKAKLLRAGLRSAAAATIHRPKTTAKDTSILKGKKAEQEAIVKTKNVDERKKSTGIREVGSDFSSDDNEPLLVTKKPRLREPQKSQVRTRSRVAEDEEKETRETRPTRRTKVAAAIYVEEMSRKLASISPPSHEDDTSPELAPELTTSRRSEAKALPKKAPSKKTVPKHLLKKTVTKTQPEALPGRPSRRSAPIEEKPKVNVPAKNPKKTVIRDLIQKKKQMSLRTLTRLKNLPAKAKLTGPKVKDKEEKAPAKGEKPKKVEPKEEKESKPSTSSVIGHRLRGKPKEQAPLPATQKLTKTTKQVPKKAPDVKQKETIVTETKSKSKQVNCETDAPPKRPVRKCSTIDKIWIDVDGFTSDEDDFIDVESIAPGANDKKNVSKTKSVKKNSSKDAAPEETQSSNKKQTSAKDKVNKSEAKTSSHTSSVKSAPVANNPVQVKEASSTIISKGDEDVPKTSMGTAKTNRKMENIPDLKRIEHVQSSKTGPAHSVKADKTPSNNSIVKDSPQPKPEVAPKEVSTPPFLATVSPSKSSTWTNSASANSGSVCSEQRKESITTENTLHSGAPTPYTHSLIARLASNVSMTSKPSTTTIDIKPKDLKSTAYLAPIKEEKYMKSETKFSSTKLDQSTDVDDKKNVLVSGPPPQLLLHSTEQKTEKQDIVTQSSLKTKHEDVKLGEKKKAVSLNNSNVSGSKSETEKISIKKSEATNFTAPIVIHSKTKAVLGQCKVTSLPKPDSSTKKDFISEQQGKQKNSVTQNTKEKFSKTKEIIKTGNRGKLKVSEAVQKTVKPKGTGKNSGQKNVKVEAESSDESESSAEVVVRKRGRRPSPRAEVVTRRERPKRQCSATGKSWIERDSDDSSFYDDGEEDVLELIRRSELALQKREERQRKALPEGASQVNEGVSEHFSESDDEPLMKKTLSAPWPTSPATVQTKEELPLAKNAGGESEVPQECDNRLGASDLDAVPAPSVTFHKVPLEPFNTHGLDLLSEVVAVADKSRIEQWLKEAQKADNSKGFLGFDESEIRRPPLPVPNSTIPDPILQFVRTPHEVPRPPPLETRRSTPKPEILKRPPVSSVQDLLKLQKEKKEAPKQNIEQHSKNCKCNSCVVKKAWFKNKPVPEEPKPSAKDLSLVKPFQSLTQVFGEITSGKASVTVAPFVQTTDSVNTKSGMTRKMSFLERMRERERKEALIKPNTQPFSPSNESSVYAFEPEPEKQNSSFRTPPRPAALSTSRTPSSSTSHDDDTEDANSRHQSTSIAVQVNMDTSVSTPEPTPLDDGKSIEISTQTEGADEDPDSQMFYIPLQQSSADSSTQQPLIQGVTVKLGTEGPVGPNQKVVMQAKLVTKPLNMPSMKAVVMPQQKLKDTKNTPVGTVQPTTRRPPAQTTSPRPRDNTSPSAAKNKEVQNCAKTDTKSHVTPLRLESPLAASTPRPPKETIKPSGSASTPEASSATSESTMVVEAPTFYLTEKEFQDPLEFFERIRPAAERFGICRIVPPSSFKPDCKVADDMRFTAYNQYVHRMLHRWGPSVRETMAMKKYLKTQCISLKPPPCVGGMEVDLPRLYQAVQNCGGLMKVMEKQKWQQVADLLRIPKAAHDRATKLDAIYCQYLLPYDTLKPEERKKLLEEVDADWEAHEQKMGMNEQEGEDDEEDYIEECEECIVKGRSMALNQFYRIARNTMSMWFKAPEPAPEEVEAEFWRHVTERKHHVCVHSGSIDSSGWGYGFPIGKNTFAKHPWNLKVLTNNSGSVLRSLGPVMGVTVPTLHVGMVFAAFCWYRDPHGLPWVEYLHTGAPKIWYGISDDNSNLFREALTKLLPKHIKNQRIWLPCDTAMAPPARLAELGVPLSRTTQLPGQFVVVFPRAFTSSLCTGYLVSESVYFARPSWLLTAEEAFRDIHDSAEPSVFSLDNLLLSIAADNRASLEILQQVLPMVKRIRERETSGRRMLQDLGLIEEVLPRETSRRRGRSADPEPEHECEICRASLFLSMVSNSAEETVYCLKHGLEQLTAHPDQATGCKILYTHDQDEINQIVEALEERIEAKATKNNKK